MAPNVGRSGWFGPTLWIPAASIARDDPMHAYAAGGMERGIVIHPRSIQDVYYYSLPR